MKNLKVMLAAVLFSTLGANLMQAQDKPAQAETQAAKTPDAIQQLFKQLELTKEQQPQYKEIGKRYSKAINDVRVSALDKDQKIAKFNELEQQKETEIKNILSTEQFKTYLKLQEERKAKFLEIKKQQMARQEAMRKEKEQQQADAAKTAANPKDGKDSKETKETKPVETKIK